MEKWKRDSLDEMVREAGFCAFRNQSAQFEYVQNDFSKGKGTISRDRKGVGEILRYKFNEDRVSDLQAMFVELVENVYRYGLKNQPGEKCQCSVYVGEKGAVFATKQESNFLDDERIKAILERRRVRSIAEDNPELKGHAKAGLKLIMDLADGVYIDKENKSIYFLAFPETNPGKAEK